MRITYRYNGRRLPHNVLTPSEPATDKEVIYHLRDSRLLGKGAWGEVYSVTTTVSSDGGDRQDHRLVVKSGTAVNRKKDGEEDEDERKQIKREAEFFKEVHGGPVHVSFQLVKTDRDGDREEETYDYHLVCKELPGYTLQCWLESRRLSLLEKLKMLDAVYAALGEQLHSNDIFHGDFKPDNILVAQRRDGSYKVSIIDFGNSYRASEKATTFDISTNHYWHPSRCEKGADVAPDPFQDVYSLSKHLDIYTRWERPPFLRACYNVRAPVTIAEVREKIAIEIRLLNVQRRINDIVNELEPDTRRLFIQLATTRSPAEQFAFLHTQQPELFADLDERVLSRLDYNTYSREYTAELNAYLLAPGQHLATVCATRGELRASLPDYLLHASDRRLDRAVEQAQTPAITTFSHYVKNNPQVRLMIYAVGQDDLQAFLTHLPGDYGRFAETLDPTLLPHLWSGFNTALRTPAKRDAIVNSLAEASDDTITMLAGTLTDYDADAVRAKLTSAAANYQRQTAWSALDALERMTDPRLTEVRAFWRARLNTLNGQDPAASFDDWKELSQQLCLSVAIVKGFLDYETGKRSTNSTYQRYALTEPEKHDLPALCHLVAETSGGFMSRLHRESFFPCVLNQKACWGQKSALMPLLEEEELVECFDKEHYRRRAGREESGFFSVTRTSCDELLTAVKAYSEKHPPSEQAGDTSSTRPGTTP